jgi:hypothetical protein
MFALVTCSYISSIFAFSLAQGLGIEIKIANSESNLHNHEIFYIPLL